MAGPKDRRERDDDRDATTRRGGGGQDVERELPPRNPDDVDQERQREMVERRPHRDEP
jgi:hypothetical protein